MTLDSIIERLEKAESGDRELDALIWCHFAAVKYSGHNEPYGGGPLTQVSFTIPPRRARIVTGKGHGSNPLHQHAEPVTSSVDAAIALATKVLPGWLWVLKQGFEPSAMVWNVETDRDQWPEEYAATPALALSLAILKAKQMGVGE